MKTRIILSIFSLCLMATSCSYLGLETDRCKGFDFEEAFKLYDDMRAKNINYNAEDDDDSDSDFTDSEYEKMIGFCTVAFENAIEVRDEVMDLETTKEREEEMSDVMRDYKFQDQMYLCSSFYYRLTYKKDADEDISSSLERKIEDLEELQEKAHEKWEDVKDYIEED